jgi:hypothetical protein
MGLDQSAKKISRIESEFSYGENWYPLVPVTGTLYLQGLLRLEVVVLSDENVFDFTVVVGSPFQSPSCPVKG